MDQLEQPHELLLEKEIISSEEKQEILDTINEGFIIRNEDMYDLGGLSAKSSGLFFPFSIAVISIIITILILLLTGIIFNQNNGIYYASEYSESSSSEWGILKVYMEESTKKLENKDSEISRYQEEIVAYNLKITTLKDLLRIKTETEKRLAEEREKLLTQGIDEEDITSKITFLEENLKSELTPAMITYYNLSIDDINRQIEIVLADKTESEENLKISLNEYKELVTENEQLEDEIKAKSDKINQVTEAIEAMKIMTEVTTQYENENAVRVEISELYFDIFTSINNEDYKNALEQLINLRLKLEESAQSDNSSHIQYPLYNGFLKVLDAYVEKLKISKEGEGVKDSKIENIIEKITILSEKVVNNSDKDKYKSVESELRTLVASVPGLESAFSILNTIDKLNAAGNESLIDEAKEIENTEGKDTNETIVEEINSSKELILLGNISKISFDKITIDLLVDMNIRTGMKFYIFKKNDFNTERVLGSGTIVDVVENTVSGKLESLYISSSKPAADDLIYIKLDIDL